MFEKEPGGVKGLEEGISQGFQGVELKCSSEA